MYFVNFFIILISLVFLLVILLSMYPVKVAAAFNSEQQPDVYLMMSWLNPFLKVYVTRHDDKIILRINIFNKRVLIKNLSFKKDIGFRLRGKSYMDYIDIAKSLKINNAKLYAAYGFENPAVTGMLCGAIGFILQYINLDELYNNPDFVTDISYFNISAEAAVNAAVSFIRVLRRNIQYTNEHALGGNR